MARCLMRARLIDGRLDLPPGRRGGDQHLLAGAARAGSHAVAGAVRQGPCFGQERSSTVQDAAVRPPETGAGLGAQQDRRRDRPLRGKEGSTMSKA